MLSDIHNIVRKMTSHLKAPQAEGINPASIDALLLQAHRDLNKPGSPTRKRFDENAKIKEHLIDILN